MKDHNLLLLLGGIGVCVIYVVYLCSKTSDDPATTTATTTSAESEPVRVMKANGFHDVAVTDTSYFTTEFRGCGEDDGVAYTATGTNSNGARVTATVCCGGPMSFKGCTIRY